MCLSADMVFMASNLLKKRPDILQETRSRMQHIFVGVCVCRKIMRALRSEYRGAGGDGCHRRWCSGLLAVMAGVAGAAMTVIVLAVMAVARRRVPRRHTRPSRTAAAPHRRIRLHHGACSL